MLPLLLHVTMTNVFASKGLEGGKREVPSYSVSHVKGELDPWESLFPSLIHLRLKKFLARVLHLPPSKYFLPSYQNPHCLSSRAPFHNNSTSSLSSPLLQSSQYKYAQPVHMTSKEMKKAHREVKRNLKVYADFYERLDKGRERIVTRVKAAKPPTQPCEDMRYQAIA